MWGGKKKKDYLSSSVHHIQHASNAIDFQLLAVTVFDRGIVFLYKIALHKPHSDCRLAYSRSKDHYSPSQYTIR
jgi:hypothetical protein